MNHPWPNAVITPFHTVDQSFDAIGLIPGGKAARFDDCFLESKGRAKGMKRGACGNGGLFVMGFQ
jgi:hypothetical protein